MVARMGIPALKARTKNAEKRIFAKDPFGPPRHKRSQDVTHASSASLLFTRSAAHWLCLREYLVLG
jgi:hypothetical protein